MKRPWVLRLQDLKLPPCPQGKHVDGQRRALCRLRDEADAEAAGVTDLFDRLVDEIAGRVKADVLEELARRSDPEQSPWLDAKGAADYLACSRERLYKRLHLIPHHRGGGRLLFRRDELDAYVESFRERRP